MNKRYRLYIGKGTENDRLISQLETIEQSVNLAREKLYKEYGAQALAINREGKAVGLYFIERQKQPFLRAEQNAGHGYIYYPKRNTKKGKELHSKLESPDINFILSKMSIITESLGLNNDAFDAQEIDGPVIGYKDGNILVAVPVNIQTKVFTVPEWLHEVTTQEWNTKLGKEVRHGKTSCHCK